MPVDVPFSPSPKMHRVDNQNMGSPIDIENLDIIPI